MALIESYWSMVTAVWWGLPLFGLALAVVAARVLAAAMGWHWPDGPVDSGSAGDGGGGCD
jgi:hypothetical protein